MSNPFFLILTQAGYYGLVIVATLFFCGAFLKGFFVNYFQVRTSFGKLVMVKIRTPLRDHFKKGELKDGFLQYKVKTGFREYDTIRLNIPERGEVFYKCLGVVWVDVDEDKNGICKADYSTVTGYDAVKNNNLHVRALTKPTITSDKEKLILLLIIVVGVIALASAYMAYSSNANVTELAQQLPGMFKGLRGTVTGGVNV